MTENTIESAIPPFRISPLAQIILCCLAIPASALAKLNCTDFGCIVSTPDEVVQLAPGDRIDFGPRLIINTNSQSTASLTINGLGANNDSGFAKVDVVHVKGSGKLIVDNGALFSAIESNISDSGTLIVDNGARFDVYKVDISDSGTLIVDNGARFVATDRVVISDSGTLIADNGAMLDANSMVISDFGTLIVDNGTKFDVRQQMESALAVGDNQHGSNSYGSVNVDNGAELNVYGNLKIGSDGSNSYGMVSIDNGATLYAYDIILGNNNTDIKDHFGILTVSNGSNIYTYYSIKVYGGIFNIGASASDEAVGAGYVTAKGGIILGSELAEPNASGVLNFNHTDTDYVFSPTISGNGFVTVGSGHTTLDSLNTYAGYTIVQGGTLQAGTEGAFSQNADYFMTQKGSLDLNGISQTVGSYSSSGTTYFNQKGDSAGTVLTVDGDYHGFGGTLVFNTVLEGDESVTDSLHITGNADGGTNVKVNNLGGKGSQTVEGIKLITVEGDIAEGIEFRQDGRIVAGAYDYRLVQGGDGGSNSSWYLTSGAGGVDPTVPPDPIDPIDPTVPPDPIDPIDPTDPELPEPPEPPILPEVPEVSISRPEAGSYIANLAATEMFFTRMEDRGREHIYTDMLTGEKKQTSMWLRSEGRHLDSNDSSGQLSTRENRYAIQIGGDITDGSFTGTDSWRLGLMTGYGNSHSNTRSDTTGYQSKGDVDGYTMGLYGSWFENADHRSGAWVDTWLQYAWFSNSVQGDDLAQEKYDSDGLQASVETGYAFVLPGGKSIDYIIEPQAQAIWNGVKADEHRESNGTVVKSDGTNNVHTRLGVKGALEIRTGGESDAVWKPYVAVNWHHNTKEYGVKMDDITLSTSGARNTGELKAGVEGQLTPQLSIWGGASGQAGSDDYRDLGGFLGVRYGF